MSYLEDRTGLDINEARKLYEVELSNEEIMTLVDFYKWKIDAVVDDFANLKTRIETSSIIDLEDARELLHYLTSQMEKSGIYHKKL